MCIYMPQNVNLNINVQSAEIMYLFRSPVSAIRSFFVFEMLMQDILVLSSYSDYSCKHSHGKDDVLAYDVTV